jgi:hypothetical protein
VRRGFGILNRIETIQLSGEGPRVHVTFGPSSFWPETPLRTVWVFLPRAGRLRRQASLRLLAREEQRAALWDGARRLTASARLAWLAGSPFVASLAR